MCWTVDSVQTIVSLHVANITFLETQSKFWQSDFMKSTIQSNFASALLTVSLAIAINPVGAFAQGSAGGSIGNDDKAVSGSREAPRAVEPSKPARRSKPEAEEPRRASRKSGWATMLVAISMEFGFFQVSARPAAPPPRRWSSAAARSWGNTAPVKSVRMAPRLDSEPLEA
jgi:hypothetical protein